MQDKFFFDEFEVDALKRTLLNNGRPVPLNPKAFDVLFALVSHHGQVLSKQELLDLVWKDQFVEEKNLTVHVTALRKALGETKTEHRFIATVPGSGYKFVARVTGAERVPQLAELAQTEGGVRSAGWFRRHAIAVGAVGLALFLGAAGYFWQHDRKARVLAASSTTMSIRRLTFDGKATNAALSPDGKLFAYSHFEGEDQSLWLGHIDGGEPFQIRPPAPVVYSDIKFTPDASGLFYTLIDDKAGGGAVYRMPVFGGLPEKVEDKPYGITFSPSGKDFAFVRDGGDAGKRVLVVCDADGKAERELAASPENMTFAWQGAAWSPDGATIAIGAYGNETDASFEVFTVAAADGSVRRLTNGAWRRISSVAWLPDGTALIVIGEGKGSNRAQISLVSFPEGVQRSLIKDLNAYGSATTFGKDQNALMTVQVQAQSNIWIASTDDLARAKQVTFSSIGRRDGTFGIKWLADGKIAYTAEGDENNTIWIMEPDGSGQKQFIPSEGNNVYPSATADDRFMVFQSDHGGDYAVWRTGRDGSDILKLTDKGIAAQPDVSPDGHWVVYVTNPENAGELWRMTISGADPAKLADGASWPRISPDSRSVACALVVDGKTKLAVLSIDGGPPTQLFDLPRLANVRLGVRWTPDGKAVTYRDWANGIWRQDLAGGGPQRLTDLPEEKIYAYDWSPDGKLFAFTRGIETRDVVLISDFK